MNLSHIIGETDSAGISSYSNKCVVSGGNDSITSSLRFHTSTHLLWNTACYDAPPAVCVDVVLQGGYNAYRRQRIELCTRVPC